MSARRVCRCGCDKTVGVGRKYRPGHDRRHVEYLAAEYKRSDGVGREVIEVRARAELTLPLFTEYLRRTGASS